MRLFLTVLSSALLLTSAKIYRVKDSDDPKYFKRIKPVFGSLADYTHDKKDNDGAGDRKAARRMLEEEVQQEAVDGSVFKARGGVKIEPPVDEAGAVDPECDFYPEVVLVQDISTSFENNIATMVEVMPEIFDFFDRKFHGKAKFSITTFVDKGVAGWGTENDFCLSVDMPLQLMDTQEVVDKAIKTFKDLYVGGGADFFDGANTGIFRAALSSKVGWNEATHDPVTGKPILRIVLLVTDAGFHEPGYHNKIEVDEGRLKELLPDNTLLDHRTDVDRNPDFGCKTMDYPKPEQMAAIFKERNILPIIFAGPPTVDGRPNQIWSQYKRDVIDRHTDHPEFADPVEGLASYFGWYFSESIGVDAVVHTIDSASSDFIPALEAAMADATELTCYKSTTTTLAPPPPPPTQPPTPTEAPEPPAPTEAPEPPAPTEAPEPPAPTDAPEPPAPTDAPEPPEPEKDTTGAAPVPSGDGDDGGHTSPAAIIGAASGGAAVAAAAGLIAAKKFGLLFNGNSATDMNVTQDVDNVDVTEDREQFEAVTGDLFA